MEKSIKRHICGLSRLTTVQLRQRLQTDSKQSFILTRALINIVFNLLKVQSIEPTKNQKAVFARHESQLRSLLALNRSLASKSEILINNSDLVLAISETCKKSDSSF